MIGRIHGQSHDWPTPTANWNFASEKTLPRPPSADSPADLVQKEDFAQKSGIKYTSRTKIESGVIKTPSVVIMAKIAKALGVSIEALLK